MAIEQREVYLFPHPTHPDTIDPHPFIILSVRKANDKESTAIGVMVTTSPHTNDQFSFQLTDAMFERPLGKPGSHARMHLVTLLFEEQANTMRPVNKMKGFFFNQLMKVIGATTFNFNFTPL